MLGITAHENVVTGLADIVRARSEAREFIHRLRPDDGTDDEDPGGWSLDAVAAAARAALEPLDLSLDPEAVHLDVVTGALLYAMTVANPPPRGIGEQQVLRATEVEIQPPWEIRVPALLDPSLWPLATAIHIQ